jgi:hypothetical protein
MIANKARIFQRNPTLPPGLQEQIRSTSHFPTLGNPTASSSRSNNVWGKGKAIEVVSFCYPVSKLPDFQIKKPPPPKEEKAPSPKPVRRRIIPLPEVWTENMRLKLEARAAGLPEPPDIEPPLPQPPLDIKKKKAPKKKTVNLEVLKQRLNEQPVLNEEKTKSKFSSLREMS